MVLDLHLRESQLVKPHDYRFSIVVENLRFPSTLKLDAGVFRFLRFEERFREAPFSSWISVDGRPNRRNKSASLNSSRVVWIWPYSSG